MLIDEIGDSGGLAEALTEAVYDAGGRPFYTESRAPLQAAWMCRADDEAMKMQSDWDRLRMEQMDAYIGLRSGDNPCDLSDVPEDRQKAYRNLYETPVHFHTRIPHTKWLAMRVPNASSAQAAGMSTKAFEKFYFDCCCLDYAKFTELMQPLARRIMQADRVEVRGEGVELRFSIRGIGAAVCGGTRNLPDGEVFTAPVRDSVEGYIRYNTPADFESTVFDGVELKFSQGKIVAADCLRGDRHRLEAVFDTDEGARYIGEFSFGTNPFIDRVVGNILFDEKAAGSFHFTPGNTYSSTDNGNRSGIHWDMVYRMQPEYGGCEIFFDGELIEKDGLFIPDYLKQLNPEQLRETLAV